MKFGDRVIAYNGIGKESFEAVYLHEDPDGRHCVFYIEYKQATIEWVEKCEVKK